ncbi:hypothetical protein EJB05_40483, partial [Eragrostis curvula]
MLSDIKTWSWMQKEKGLCLGTVGQIYRNRGRRSAANANATANFFCVAGGVYASTHPPVPLPADPSLSLVPHLLARLPCAHPHAPALLDAATSNAISRADLRCLVSSLAAGPTRRLGLRK